LVGVIAVEGAKHCPSEARDALRLLSQVGAVSLQAQAKYKEMKATASIDGLTGVYNKRYLTHRLAEEMRRAVDATSSVSVFIFDIDNFKHYNDRNGHVAGDRLLQRLVRLALDNVRQDTVFGRYGDEEFLVIFPRSTRAQALAAAENIQLAVAAHDFAFGFDQPLGIVSISGGVAECPIDGADAATLVRAADEALYEAKRAGRNRVFPYQPLSIGGAEAPPPVSAQCPSPREASMPESTEIASDFTPRPGTLFALADITPAAGIPKLTLEPSPEVLAAAVAAAPPLTSPPPKQAEVAVEASGRAKGRGAREPGGERGRDPEAAEAGPSGRP
ncbi:MAG TPA: GGDEF domain-containing protein, partial [Vicinamibacteria bacterium]|nr:GGDEF domain-containing protein [Vicinamibacteria bacterium]